MGLFSSPPVIGIARDTLEFIVGTCEDTHPDEFMGLMRAESTKRLHVRDPVERDGRVITDILVIPGTKSGNAMASLREDMIPMNVGGIGTVHSHPSGSTRPSNKDLQTFSKKGDWHIIVGKPYTTESWECYNSKGEPADLPVLEVEFEEQDPFETENEGIF